MLTFSPDCVRVTWHRSACHTVRGTDGKLIAISWPRIGIRFRFFLIFTASGEYKCRNT
nr:MAG TPA: hypothetical protein [Caudoviricetes sp.]